MRIGILIIVLIWLCLLLVCQLVIIQLIKYQDYNPTSETRLEENLLDSRVDKFVWSGSLQDWAIVDKFQSIDPPRDISHCIWPHHQKVNFYTNCSADRLIEQLLLSDQSEYNFQITILNDRSLELGSSHFAECSVKRCSLTRDRYEADIVVSPNSDVFPDVAGQQEIRHQKSRAEQIWIAYLLESPENTFDLKLRRKFRNTVPFNWTATYRSDSTLVTPYAKFVPYSSKLAEFMAIKNESTNTTIVSDLKLGDQNYQTTNKSIIAWFVSNCHAKNKRLDYARELAKYIPVDIYGKCGPLKCDKQSQDYCLHLLGQKYKFYLSFENSNSREYITEKLYRNGLGWGMEEKFIIPIVMGASKEDYTKAAPPGSFIHVDDFKSPKHLAQYLIHLSIDSNAFQAYFRWRKLGRFIDTKFLCRICALAHHSRLSNKSMSISDLSGWWLETNKSIK